MVNFNLNTACSQNEIVFSNKRKDRAYLVNEQKTKKQRGFNYIDSLRGKSLITRFVQNYLCKFINV